MIGYQTITRSSVLATVVATILATICMLAACAGPAMLVDSPTIRLTRIESGHMSFNRQTFVLGFDISNPNSFPLPVQVLNYNVQIADQQFASGKTDGAFTVPANGDSSFAISVDLDMMQQTSRIGTLLRAGSQGQIPYELNGSLTVDIPFTQAIPFSNKGTISLISGL
jgi:LEA14-like dessication related protein